MANRILTAVKRHPLMDTLIVLKGNPKVCILIEPLWGIPANLIIPFATVYMHALGVTDIEIGLILSLAMVVQVAFSFLGGIFADKFGRKTTTMLGDFFGWVLPCLIWAVSQNFWFFLAAVLLNSFEQINQTAWSCLLIEDADKSKTVNIYTWITIAGLLSVFFAPISGLLIGSFTLVPVMRALYFSFSMTMVIKWIITYKYTSETKQGIIRKAETKGKTVLTVMYEYKDLLPQIFRNRETLKTLAIMIILYISNMATSNFFGLYVSDTLNIPEEYLAYFPIIRAAIMIIFMFGVQHRINPARLKLPMEIGFVLGIGGQLMLVFAPEGNIAVVAGYILLEAMAAALIMPRKDTMVVMNVDEGERARIVALLTAFMIAFSAPFGYMIGAISALDRRLPFVFVTVLFILGMAVIGMTKEKKLSAESE